ncbi:MAG: hypothetical protein ACE5J9_07530, partial [Methanosarcinales archaeon]
MEVTIKNINLYIELQIKYAWTGNMMEDSEIEQRLNELTLRLNALESRIDRASPDVMLKEMLDIKEKLGALKQLTEYSDEKIDALSKKVYSLENKINELEKKLSTVENNLRIEIN